MFLYFCRIKKERMKYACSRAKRGEILTFWMKSRDKEKVRDWKATRKQKITTSGYPFATRKTSGAEVQHGESWISLKFQDRFEAQKSRIQTKFLASIRFVQSRSKISRHQIEESMQNEDKFNSSLRNSENRNSGFN